MYVLYHNKRMKDMILGIDIGGTKIRAVLWNGRQAMKFYESKTPGNISKLEAILTKLLERLTDRTSQPHIGIGAAGIVTSHLLMKSPNIKYIKKLDFHKLFNKVLQGLSTKYQIKIDNDARCFLRAEIYDAIPRLNKGLVLGVTLGTGVGRALARNGKVLKIKKLEYPEEWEVRYQKVRDEKNNSKLADFLAKKLTILISARKPRTIVVGGGVSHRTNFVSLLRSALKQQGLAMRVSKSRLGQDSVAIGAALISDISSISDDRATS